MDYMDIGLRLTRAQASANQQWTRVADLER